MVARRSGPLTIAVTGMNATDNPAPGVGVLRALREGAGDADDRLIGLAYDALDPGVYAAAIAPEVFMIPYPSQGLDAFLSRLRYVHQRVGLDVIIPTLDAELPSFIRLEPELRAMGIGVLLPTAEQLDLRSKVNLAALGQRAGIRVPKTVVVSDADELYRAHEKLPYPFFVKAAGKNGEALAALDALPSPHKDGYVAELRRGWLLYKLGKSAEAIDAYGRAVAKEPRSIEARVGALLPAMALRRWADVETGAREVLKLDPGNYLAGLRLAFAEYNLGRYTDAAAQYKRLVDAYPSDVDVRSGLGWSLLKTGKATEAAAEFRAVLDVAPRTALAADGFKAATGRAP